MIELSGAIKAGLFGGFVIGIVFSSVLRFVGKLDKWDEILSYKQILCLSVATGFIGAIFFGILYYLGLIEYIL